MITEEQLHLVNDVGKKACIIFTVGHKIIRGVLSFTPTSDKRTLYCVAFESDVLMYPHGCIPEEIPSDYKGKLEKALGYVGIRENKVVDIIKSKDEIMIKIDDREYQKLGWGYGFRGHYSNPEDIERTREYLKRTGQN